MPNDKTTNYQFDLINDSDSVKAGVKTKPNANWNALDSLLHDDFATKDYVEDTIDSSLENYLDLSDTSEGALIDVFGFDEGSDEWEAIHKGGIYAPTSKGENGWGHITLNKPETSYGFRFPAYKFSKSGFYTLLVEWKNVVQDRVYHVLMDYEKLQIVDPNKNMLIGGLSATTEKQYSTESGVDRIFLKVDPKSTSKDFFFFVPYWRVTGSADMRISLYEGVYKGDYKPMTNKNRFSLSQFLNDISNEYPKDKYVVRFKTGYSFYSSYRFGQKYVPSIIDNPDTEIQLPEAPYQELVEGGDATGLMFTGWSATEQPGDWVKISNSQKTAQHDKSGQSGYFIEMFCHNSDQHGWGPKEFPFLGTRDEILAKFPCKGFFVPAGETANYPECPWDFSEYGYRFSAWVRSSPTSLYSWNWPFYPGSSMPLSENTVGGFWLSPYWVRDAYCIRFYHDPILNNPSTFDQETTPLNSNKVFNIPHFNSENGTTFVKWISYDANFDIDMEIEPGDSIQLQDDVALFPVYEESDTFKAVFAAGDGTGDDVIVEFDSSNGVTTLASPPFTPPTHYSFSRWKMQSGVNASGNPTYTNKNKNVLVTGINNDLYFYATYTRSEWVVSFDANAGTGTMADEVVAKNNSLTIPSCSFTAPSGQQFQKWNTKADGTGTDYNPTDTLSPTADVTLYAIWQAV